MTAMIKSFVGGGTVVLFGWYLQTIIIIYILFWIVYSCKVNDSTKVILMVAINTAFWIICFLLKITVTWYATSICFSLGIVWGYFKEKIDLQMNNKKTYFMVFGMCLAAVPCAYIVVKRISNEVLSEALQVSLTALIFTVLVVMISRIFRYDNIVTKNLGEISLEIYTMQGILFLNNHIQMLAEQILALYVVVILIGTILLALIFHPITVKVNNAVKKNI